VEIPSTEEYLLMHNIFKGRHILGIIFILIGYFYLYLSHNSEILYAGSVLEAMDYPRFLLYIWLFLSVLYLIIPREKMDLSDFKMAAPLIVKMAALMSIYVFILGHVGFICSSMAFLWSFFYLFKDRRYIRMLSISGLSAVALWFVFEIILQTPLPLGFWAEILY